MNAEKICLSSKAIDIAENDLYLEITNRLCYYDDINLNNVMLPYEGYEESANEAAQTLVNMPVQARYKKINNEDDLGGHEMHILSDGSVEFLTESIGTHISAEIKNDTVITVMGETKTLPCLFATCRVWKRNKNMIAAIKRLFESDDGLNTSWEISTTSYEYKDGIKILKEYSFMANTFLGSKVTPAYAGTSNALSLSSIDADELLVAEALSQDIIENSAFNIDNIEAKEEEVLQDNGENKIAEEAKTSVSDVAEQVDVSNTEPIEENTGETSEATIDNKVDTDTSDKSISESIKNDTDSNDKTDTSALTEWDLRNKVNRACREKVNNYAWCWLAYLFPVEQEAWCEYDGDSELDYLQFSYEVNGNEVTVSDPIEITLQATPKTINTTISEYEKTISEKDELIVKASSEINNLKSQLTELSQYKEKFTKMEQEKAEAELAQKKEDLISAVVKSGQITREEIDSSEELTNYVNTLDKKSLMAIVGERLSASMDTNKEVEVSEVTTGEHVVSNINTDDSIVDKASIMRNYLRN